MHSPCLPKNNEFPPLEMSLYWTVMKQDEVQPLLRGGVNCGKFNSPVEWIYILTLGVNGFVKAHKLIINSVPLK